MTYLTGKRFEYLRESDAPGTKTGVIVSEPFRTDEDEGGATCVAVQWDDGSMDGRIDIELLKVLEEDIGYVVCKTCSRDDDGELISATYTKWSSLEHAKKRINNWKMEDTKMRIGKIIFPFEGVQ